jgi:IS5 family transposase
MGNLARQLGPEVIEKLHRRVVEIAQENKIATGRKMRMDTTVVETDIHYPTDSSLLGDGVRVLTRIMESHRRGGPGRHADARPQPVRQVEGFGDCAGQP